MKKYEVTEERKNEILEKIVNILFDYGFDSNYLSKFNYISMSNRCVVVLSENKRNISDGKYSFDGRNIVVTTIEIVKLLMQISTDWKELCFELPKNIKINNINYKLNKVLLEISEKYPEYKWVSIDEKLKAKVYVNKPQYAGYGYTNIYKQINSLLAIKLIQACNHDNFINMCWELPLIQKYSNNE